MGRRPGRLPCHNGRMDNTLWDQVDSYLAGQLVGDDDVLSGTLRASADAGLPPISVSPLQGKFLYVLARLMGARRVLEVGSLGGYSAIWMGRPCRRRPTAGSSAWKWTITTPP